jgi:hypothetical protein
VPPELRGLRQLREAEDLLRRIGDPDLRGRERRRLRLLELRLHEARGRGIDPALMAEFDDALRRLAAGAPG